MFARPRPTPFDLAFADLAAERFPAIRDALAAEGTDSTDRDAFLLNREAVTLVRELRPEDGVGEEIGQLAALVHQAYRFWTSGGRVSRLDREQTERLLEAGEEFFLPTSSPGRPAAEASSPAVQLYVQVPERLIWAQPVPGGLHEPLDGCFVQPGSAPEELRVLGVFGLHPDRPGFTVVEAAGPRVAHLARADGSALYAPLLAGGAAAGLHSLAGSEELLELGYRMSRGADEPMSRDPS